MCQCIVYLQFFLFFLFDRYERTVQFSRKADLLFTSALCYSFIDGMFPNFANPILFLGHRVQFSEWLSVRKYRVLSTGRKELRQKYSFTYIASLLESQEQLVRAAALHWTAIETGNSCKLFHS